MLIVLALLLAVQQLPAGGAPGVLLDRRLAESAGLSVGDTVRIRPLAARGAFDAFRVEGVFEREADPSRISRNELEVRFHLPDLQRLTGETDRVDRFAVVLEPGSDPAAAARWIESLAYGTRAYPTAALAEESSATFRVVSRFHRAIAVITILASGIFLLCVMIIRVDERRKDMATLRLIGVSRATVFRSIVLEAVGIAVVGSALGAGVGVIAARIVNAYYAGIYDTTLRFALVTPRIVLTAVALGLVLGIGAGVLAAWRLARVPPQRLGER